MNGVREHEYDAVLIGVGLASATCARVLSDAGWRVGIVEGVGRSRSLAADGGLVDPDLLSHAFDVPVDHIPLDRVVEQRQRFIGNGASPVVLEPPEPIAPRRAFRRAELEAWALRHAVARGAHYLDGFVERAVIPQADDSLRLVSEDGHRQISARMIGLCEGSDPRIALRVGLRPDYGPEDQIHFAKTLVEGNAVPGISPPYRRGPWRTSWGMPVDVSMVLLASAAVVSVAVRIENVMRCSRSAQNALDELFATLSMRALVPGGARLKTGVELVAMRPTRRRARFSVDNLLMSVDASGMLDPRDPARFDHALRAGQALASYMQDRGLGPSPDVSWDDVAMRLVREIAHEDAGYRDSPETGFLEESDPAEFMREPLRRLRDGVLARLRGGR
jgi:flavin-dependent dehydrogenase